MKLIHSYFDRVKKTREANSETRNIFHITTATKREIAINNALSELTIPDDIESIVEGERIRKLPITLHYGQPAGSLQTLH
jgi:hypothetical protein